jgi:hypothetical protein
MFDRFARSWTLVKASAAVLRSDKELLLFPVLSAIATMLVVATFVVPAFALGVFTRGMGPAGMALGFLFYLCQYFVIFFFNAALVSAAMIRLDGGAPTLADGLRGAQARIVPILGYAAIAATVGLLLQALKNRRGNLLLRLVGSGLGVAWTLSTFLVVPVLVQENVGPIDAIKQSMSLFKRTWGENAIGNVGIGLAFGLFFLLTVLVAGALVVAGLQLSVPLGIAFGVIGVLALVVLAVVQSALSGIYAAALYRYATAGESPRGFELVHAFR